MSRRYVFPSMFLLAAASAMLACGGSSSPRQVQAIVVTPASADAQSFPDGKVPFVATGTYSAAPTTVNPLTANWGKALQQMINGVPNLFPTSDVTVDSNGVAQCASGASGTYVIDAWLPATTNDSCTVIGGPFNWTACPVVYGNAQLTCP